MPIAVNRLFPGGWARRYKTPDVVLRLLVALAAAVALAQPRPDGGNSKQLFETASVAHETAEDRLRSNEIAEAQRFCRQALDILDKLVERTNDHRHRFEQAAALETLAMIDIAALQPDEADHDFRQAVNAWARLLAQDPTAIEVRRRLAACLAQHASLLAAASRWQEAEFTLHRGMNVCRTRLTADSPDPQDDQQAVLITNQLGLLFLRTRRWTESMECFDDAVALQKGLIQPGSGTGEDRELLISLIMNQAKTYFANSKPKAALRSLVEAREVAERLNAEFPSNAGYRDLTATLLESEADQMQHDRDRAAMARGLLERAHSIRKSLVAGSPSSRDDLEKLAETCGRLAESWLAAKSFDQAEACQREELTYQSRLHQENPAVPKIRFGRGRALHNLADFLRQRGRAGDALPLEREAAELLSSVYHENVKDEAYRRAVSYAYWTLAELEIDRKDVRAAAKAVSDYLAIEPHGFEEAHEAAGLLCRCIVLCREDQGTSAAERDRLARGFSDQAITALQTAVRSGFRDLDELKSSRVYDPLRDRPEFARVVHDVAAFVEVFNDR